MQAEIIWTILSFLLTVMILSYVIGDNPLFKIASYLFVGVSTGYFTVILIYQVILPKMIYPLFGGDQKQFILAAVAIILCILLLFKLSARLSGVGTLPMALLVGVGSATIISGALMGTLLPQIDATTANFSLSPTASGNLLLGLYVLIGSIATLLYFSYSKVLNVKVTNNDSKIFNFIRNFGKLFIGITFGSIFAGILLSSLVALMERVNFLISFVTSIKDGL
jgi:hypothetical protein